MFNKNGPNPFLSNKHLICALCLAAMLTAWTIDQALADARAHEGVVLSADEQPMICAQVEPVRLINERLNQALRI